MGVPKTSDYIKMKINMPNTGQEPLASPIKKIMGVCFLQVFDPSTLKASNCDPKAREYFMRNFFKIWDKIGPQFEELEELDFYY